MNPNNIEDAQCYYCIHETCNNHIECAGCIDDKYKQHNIYKDDPEESDEDDWWI